MVRGLVGGSHISCKGHRSSSKKQASIEAKECKANGKIKECKLDEQFAWSYVLSESMTVKADVGFANPNELYIYNPILQSKNNEYIPKDTNHVTKAGIGIDPFGAVVNTEQVGCKSEKLGYESEELRCDCEVYIPKVAVNGTEQTDAGGGFVESEQGSAIGSLNIMKQRGFKCRDSTCSDLNLEMLAADCQDADCARSSFENVESSSSIERPESKSGLPDNFGRAPFNKVTGSKVEKQSVCIVQEPESVEGSDRQARALFFTNGSGVVKDSLVAGSVGSSDLFPCQVEVPNGYCSPALGYENCNHASQGLGLEGESGILRSSLLSNADGKKNDNRQDVSKTSNEVLHMETMNSKEVDKRECSFLSPQQDVNKSRAETTDDRASKSSFMDCLEENVNSQAQEKSFPPGRLEDEIFNKEHEEVESAPIRISIKGDSLPRGTGVEMSLCKYPTSHGSSAFERNTYHLNSHSSASIVNIESSKLWTPREIHTATVPLCTIDKEHKKSMGDSDNLGGLDHVLDLVISLDTQEIFVDPVDESFAPNYYKVIKIPMCFKTMKEKVQAQQYRSWQAFVDDFERICYNAMKYNQIRSNIWRAAKKLLCEGKKLLEKFETRDSKLADSIKEVGDDCSLGLVSENPAPKELENVSRGKDGPNDYLVTFRYQPSVYDSLEQKGIEGAIRGGGEALRESPDLGEDSFLDQNCLKKEGEYKIDPKMQLSINSEEVDIEDCTSQGAVREDSDSQATEYSSSFECSLGEGKSDSVSTALWDSTEVQSRLRNGSAALLYPPDDAVVVEPKERKKRALNQDWKTYRRGIEWRCRWLELRIKALQDQASRYDRFLEEREVKKRWRTEHGWEIISATRAVPFTDKHIKEPVLHRKGRRKVEDSLGAAAFMSRHPLFSRYEKKKHEQDDPHEGMFDNQHFCVIEHPSIALEKAVQPDESDIDEPPSSIKGTILGEGSIEELLWNIELLQVRVVKLRNQLNKGAHINLNEVHLRSSWQDLQAKNLSAVLEAQCEQSSLPSPKGIMRPPKRRPDGGLSVVGPSKLAPSNVLAQKASGSAIVRRRTADYDISNVVMPVSVGAKYVEPVRHAKIETPHWRRLVDEFTAPACSNGGNSSDEGTDDELYMKMHDQMEVKERLHRMPHSLKRHMDEAGTSTIYRVVKARGKVISMDPIELDRKGEDHCDNLAAENDLTFSAALTKGKRTRRDSKGNFTHSRGRKLLNLFAETSNLKRSFQ